MVGIRLRYGSCEPRKPAAIDSTKTSTARIRSTASVALPREKSLMRGRRTSRTKSAITANVTTRVAPAPASQSSSGSGRSKRWPKPCAAAPGAAQSKTRLRMYFEIEDGPVMMGLAMRVLGHREAPRDARGERHARRRLRRHRGFDVVAMQVQHDAPVARPAQPDLVALGDAQGIGAGGELAAGELEVEGTLGGARRGERQHQ